ncbi:uncharacterized protein LOC129613650 [Condylostylus longicornis]|uniref:uncharacterized protein LOC129613650 n=1 Tax=Condylostylus longicornis TaxID=2530218 RepID=UPI00244DBC49|nr:uncharacterized protein LOC129613650 [Condylostylus longicornis]XP_055383776.1 uncharacterized protein LOC129613650 [Condylostylus longicornis]XP_055383777.1 uncharacterized protein LOC129613650 [Condylostylus longicornis]XP_055383778.1 uncharacterized protein LOC129613650 [Condylostylus longicornis]
MDIKTKNCEENNESLTYDIKPEKLENLIKIIDKTNDFNLKCFENILCSPGSSSGDNYMSVIKRVHIFGKDFNNQEQCFTVIVKRQIPSKSRRELYRCDEAFNNEINAYKYVIPMLENYCNRQFLPKCFFAGNDENGEIIVLEDLKQLGFKMKNRLIALDFDHCVLVMKELARMHAASISAKELNQKDFHQNRQQIKEIVYCKEAEEFYRNVLDSSITNALLSLHLSNTNNFLTEPIKSIELLRTTLFERIQNLIITSKCDAYNVICHGDLWVNNIMFKWNYDEKSPIDAKFFDLQTMRYTSLVFDILHFIYTSTKRDLREVNLKNILQSYSSALILNLENNFLPNNYEKLKNIKDIYSLENIMKQFYTNILYGLVAAIWILPAVTFDPTNIPNLNDICDDKNVKELNLLPNLTQEYHDRIKDITLEFYENGFLQI